MSVRKDSVAALSDKELQDEREFTRADVIAGQFDNSALPRRWTSRELLAEIFPDPVWIVPQLIPEGLTVLAGSPKIGKSWLVLQLGSAVANGELAFGKYPVPPATVLYLALEDTARRLQQRLTLMGTEPSDRLLITTEWNPDWNAPTVLARYKKAHPELSLVIVDTLAKVTKAAVYQESRYEMDYRQVGEIKTAADAIGLSVVVVTHTRKLAAEDFLHSVSGSVGITAAADTVLALTRERGKRDAVLRATGRDIDEQELALKFDADVGTWAVIGNASEVMATNERQQIYDLLHDSDEPLKPKQIADYLQKNVSTVRNLLKKMQSDGAVTQPAYGTYQVEPVDSVASIDSHNTWEESTNTTESTPIQGGIDP